MEKLQILFLNGLERLFGQFNCLFELIVFFRLPATSPMFYNKLSFNLMFTGENVLNLIREVSISNLCRDTKA